MTFARPRLRAVKLPKPKIDALDGPIDISLFVPGIPQAWQRAGVNTKTGEHYTQEATASWKKRLVWSALAAKALPKKPTSWPCSLSLLFFFPEPKGFRLAGGQLSAEGRKHLYDGELVCENSKDLDNLAKSVLDAFNGKIWLDDHKVKPIHVDKAYTREEPGVQIRVTTPTRRGM